MGDDDDAPRIDVRPQSSGRICPYCRDALREDEPGTSCPTCATRHHAACWAEAGRCATCPGRATAAARRGRPEVTLGGPLPPERSTIGLWAVFAVCAVFALGWVASIVHRGERVHQETVQHAEVESPPRPLPPPRHPAPPAPDLRTFVRVGERFTYRIGVRNTVLERWTVTHVDAKEVRYTIAPLTLDERPNGTEREGRWWWGPTYAALYHDPGPVTTLEVGGQWVACRFEASSGGAGEWVLLTPDGTTNLFPGGIKSVGRDGTVYSQLVKIEGAPPAALMPPGPAPR